MGGYFTLRFCHIWHVFSFWFLLWYVYIVINYKKFQLANWNFIIIVFVYFSASGLKQLAKVAKKNKGPVGATTTLAALMVLNQQATIDAANANKRATTYYEKT